MESALIGLVGVVVGSLLTTVKDWWLDHAKRKREGRHLSLMTAFALDRFIEGCANVAVDGGEPDQEGCSEAQTTPPKFDPTSTHGDWRSVPLSITDAVFSLQLAAEEVAARVSVAFEFDTPPDWEDGFKVRQTGYADLGIRAFELSNRLRGNAGVATRAESTWPVGRMRETKARFETLDRLRAAELPLMQVGAPF